MVLLPFIEGLLAILARGEELLAGLQRVYYTHHAIVQAIKHWSYYLAYNEFIIHTDHEA